MTTNDVTSERQQAQRTRACDKLLQDLALAAHAFLRPGEGVREVGTLLSVAAEYARALRSPVRPFKVPYEYVELARGPRFVMMRSHQGLLVAVLSDGEWAVEFLGEDTIREWLHCIPADMIWQSLAPGQRRRFAQLAGPALADIPLAERLPGYTGPDILAAMSDEQRGEAACAIWEATAKEPSDAESRLLTLVEFMAKELARYREMIDQQRNDQQAKDIAAMAQQLNQR